MEKYMDIFNITNDFFFNNTKYFNYSYLYYLLEMISNEQMI